MLRSILRCLGMVDDGMFQEDIALGVTGRATLPRVHQALVP